MEKQVVKYRGRLWFIEKVWASKYKPGKFVYTLRNVTKLGNPGRTVLKMLGGKVNGQEHKDQNDRQQTPKDAPNTL